jgi:hypothetical protein
MRVGMAVGAQDDEIVLKLAAEVFVGQVMDLKAIAGTAPMALASCSEQSALSGDLPVAA